MSEQQDRQTAIDRLESVHSFPGDYVFKVIGDNSPEFTSKIAQVPVNVIGSGVEYDITTRESSSDNYVSVTLTVEFEQPEGVLDVYEVLNQMDEVRLVM
jgi:putative lipoic acid-binding regulatory protein